MKLVKDCLYHFWDNSGSENNSLIYGKNINPESAAHYEDQIISLERKREWGEEKGKDRKSVMKNGMKFGKLLGGIMKRWKFSFEVIGSILHLTCMCTSCSTES